MIAEHNPLQKLYLATLGAVLDKKMRTQISEHDYIGYLIIWSYFLQQ